MNYCTNIKQENRTFKFNHVSQRSGARVVWWMKMSPLRVNLPELCCPQLQPVSHQSKHLSALISSLCPLPPYCRASPPHPATSCKAFRLPAVDTNPNLWPINAQRYWIQDHNMVLSRRLMTQSSAINSDLRCHQSLYRASRRDRQCALNVLELEAACV